MSKVFQVLFPDIVCHEDICTTFNMCSEANIQLSPVMQMSSGQNTSNLCLWYWINF